ESNKKRFNVGMNSHHLQLSPIAADMLPVELRDSDSLDIGGALQRGTSPLLVKPFEATYAHLNPFERGVHSTQGQLERLQRVRSIRFIGARIHSTPLAHGPASNTARGTVDTPIEKTRPNPHARFWS